MTTCIKWIVEGVNLELLLKVLIHSIISIIYSKFTQPFDNVMATPSTNRVLPVSPREERTPSITPFHDVGSGGCYVRDTTEPARTDDRSNGATQTHDTIR